MILQYNEWCYKNERVSMLYKLELDFKRKLYSMWFVNVVIRFELCYLANTFKGLALNSII